MSKKVVRASEFKRIHDVRLIKEIGVFNPTTKDFTWKYNGKSYTVPKGEMKKFDYYLGHHLAKHLIDKILTEKDIPIDKKKARAEWQKKVLI